MATMAQPVKTEPSALIEESITSSLTVGIMNDLDDGQPTLVASRDGNQGDIKEVSLSTALQMVDEEHAKLDQIAQLAIDFEAATKGRSGEPGHHPWCEPGACFVGPPDDQGEYIDHEGPVASLRAPHCMPTEEGVLLRARLCSDASDGDGATVSITGSDGNGTLLDGSELETVITDLAAFLNQLRAMRPHLKAAA
jgi:hypothetical protein